MKPLQHQWLGRISWQDAYTLQEELVEKQRVTGIAYSRDEARITLTNVENKPGVSAGLFGPLSDAGINVDMIVQNVTEKEKQTDITAS